jgi:hypothetical protein
MTRRLWRRAPKLKLNSCEAEQKCLDELRVKEEAYAREQIQSEEKYRIFDTLTDPNGLFGYSLKGIDALIDKADNAKITYEKGTITRKGDYFATRDPVRSEAPYRQ